MERVYCFRRNSKPERKRMVERITIDSSVIAKEFDVPLVSLDGEMLERAVSMIKAQEVEDF